MQRLKLNILTFDIEDWYNCNFITPDFDWDKYEVRIYDGLERILQEPTGRNLQATFFVRGGWLKNTQKWCGGFMSGDARQLFLPLPERLFPQPLYFGARCFDPALNDVVFDPGAWLIS